MRAWRSRLLRAVAATAGVALLVRLSVWQWERGRASGRLLHYTYAVEWLLVAALLVGALVARRPRGDSTSEEPAGAHDVAGRVIGPPLRRGEQLPPTTRERATRWIRQRSRSRG